MVALAAEAGQEQRNKTWQRTWKTFGLLEDLNIPVAYNLFGAPD
jgi:hypothetical protein